MKMNVTVSIPSAFRRHTEGADHFNCAAANLNDLLDALAGRFPELNHTYATNRAMSAGFLIFT